MKRDSKAFSEALKKAAEKEVHNGGVSKEQIGVLSKTLGSLGAKTFYYGDWATDSKPKPPSGRLCPACASREMDQEYDRYAMRCPGCAYTITDDEHSSLTPLQLSEHAREWKRRVKRDKEEKQKSLLEQTYEIAHDMDEANVPTEGRVLVLTHAEWTDVQQNSQDHFSAYYSHDNHRHLHGMEVLLTDGRAGKPYAYHKDNHQVMYPRPKGIKTPSEHFSDFIAGTGPTIMPVDSWYNLATHSNEHGITYPG